MKKVILIALLTTCFLSCKKYGGQEIPPLPQLPNTTWKLHQHRLFGHNKILLNASVAENQYRAVASEIFIKIDGHSQSYDGQTTGWFVSGVDLRFKPEFSQLSFVAGSSNYLLFADAYSNTQGTKKNLYPAHIHFLDSSIDALQMAYEYDLGAFSQDEHFFTAINQTATPNIITIIWPLFTREDYDNDGTLDYFERSETKFGNTIGHADLPAETQNTVPLIKSYYNYGFISTHQNAYRIAMDGTVDKIFSTEVKDFFDVENTLYADVGTALYASTDKGKKWKQVKNNLDNNQARNYFYTPPFWGYYSLDKLYIAQPDYSFTEIDNGIIATNKITSVNKFIDSVFVTTNNGLFIKSINNFVQ